ncbi:MAG: TIGR02757 family protein [Nitrospirae bacterium]|nr:TIGR02757 family protein [Nitrospirota bacterium]
MHSARKSLKPLFQLKNILDKFYREYNFQERLKHDPIEFPHRYSNPEDIETAGFIASCLAYGKVELFKAVIEKILRPAGSRPALFFTHFELKKDSKYFRDISYRFNKEKDILGLIYILSETLKKQGSLKRHFYSCYRADHEDIGEALKEFINFFLGTDTSAIYGKNIKPHGLMQLLPSPQKGSACKRMNLFLRWMVRNMDIDFGIWDKVPPHKLIIPLDTHIAKIARCLGLTKRAASDWNTAKEITESLKKLDRRDPLKYDFALCHQGISGLCRGKKSLRVCSSCAIKPGTLCE